MYTVLVTSLSLSLSLSFHYFLTKEGNSCISFATGTKAATPVMAVKHRPFSDLRCRESRIFSLYSSPL